MLSLGQQDVGHHAQRLPRHRLWNQISELRAEQRGLRQGLQDLAVQKYDMEQQIDEMRSTLLASGAHLPAAGVKQPLRPTSAGHGLARPLPYAAPVFGTLHPHGLHAPDGRFLLGPRF